MAKDKLLTIPIEAEKRDRLNKYCQDKRIKVSELITQYIDNVLSGSIDIDSSIGSSTPIEPIEPSIAVDKSISVELVVGQVIDRLRHLSIPVDPQYVRTETFNEATRNLSAAIADIKTDTWLAESGLRNVKAFVNYSETEQGSGIVPDDRFVSIEEFDKAMKHNALVIADFAASMARTDLKVEKLIQQPIEPIEPSIEKSIDDTKTLITQKMESRRSTLGGRKTTLDEIAIQLITYSYPHPSGRKWTRTEVTRIAKEWGIRTS